MERSDLQPTADPASAEVLYTVTRDEAGVVYVLDAQDNVVGAISARVAARPDRLANNIRLAVYEHLRGAD